MFEAFCSSSAAGRRRSRSTSMVTVTNNNEREVNISMMVNPHPFVEKAGRYVFHRLVAIYLLFVEMSMPREMARSGKRVVSVGWGGTFRRGGLFLSFFSIQNNTRFLRKDC